jgi:hypothetical protein
VAADEGIFLGETFSESILAPLCRKVVLFAPKICRGAVVMLGFVSADQETGIFLFLGGQLCVKLCPSNFENFFVHFSHSTLKMNAHGLSERNE